MIAAVAQATLHDSRSVRLDPEARTSLEFMGLVYRFAPGRHLFLADLALAAAPVLYVTLESPKWIVNGALQAGDFGCLGFDVGSPAALVMLTLAQFAALGTFAGLKYAGNVLSANLGERFLRAQRLRMLHNWRRGDSAGRGGALTPMLTRELEAVSGFAGAMVATPVA